MTESSRSVKLTNDEIISNINESLITLEQLCEIYDNGRSYICFNMATEIKKVIDGNAVARRIRGFKSFTTPTDPHKGIVNLLPTMKLVAARVTTGPEDFVTFLPEFQVSQGERSRLKFREWWNRDIIYRAGAAQPGADPSLVPVQPHMQVPFKKRLVLSRRTLIETMRNKIGAHIDEVVPEFLHELQRGICFGAVIRVTNDETGEVKSLRDGTLEVRAGAGAAMVRQISEEILSAYGRSCRLTP